MNANWISKRVLHRSGGRKDLRATVGRAPARSGFTLVELLVVIVIVASLAGLLFAMANRMKKKAESAACMSNLRQLTSIALAYSSDHHGDLPMPTEAGGELAWPDTLAADLGKERPFLTEESVKCCPTQFKIFNQSRTYGINRQIDAKRQGGSEVRPARMTVFGRPGTPKTHLSAIPFFMDGVFTQNWKVHRSWAQGEPNENSFPHDGHCNMSFLDGHVEATTPGNGVWAERPVFDDGQPAF